MATNLRVLIIADDPLVRAGLAMLLADQPGWMVVGQAASEADLLATVDAVQPDVLLWDTGWNPGASLDRLAEATELRQPIAVLLPDDTFVAEAWSAGARALVRRDAEPARLAAALTAIIQGLAAIDPNFISAMTVVTGGEATSGLEHPGSASMLEELTPRELEVLRLMAEGLPNKTIAHRLGISEHTVKFHVNAILGKLGVASRTEAVVRATRLGLILL
jgi:DNA-binding NarL/FixJ family response regulator